MHFLKLSSQLCTAFAFLACVAAIPPAKPISALAQPDPPNLADAKFIWTSEGKPFPIASPVAGPRGFRRTVVLKEYVDRGYIDISCDNYYSVYVNGYLVGSTPVIIAPGSGSGDEWVNAQRYKFELPYPASELTIAVYGVQGTARWQAAVILSSVFWASPSDNPVAHKIVTDGEWKTTLQAPAPEFIKPKFDDKAWESAYEETKLGNVGSPYERLVKPTSLTTVVPVPLKGIQDSPNAPAAEAVKYIA